MRNLATELSEAVCTEGAAKGADDWMVKAGKIVLPYGLGYSDGRRAWTQYYGGRGNAPASVAAGAGNYRLPDLRRLKSRPKGAWMSVDFHVDQDGTADIRFSVYGASPELGLGKYARVKVKAVDFEKEDPVAVAAQMQSELQAYLSFDALKKLKWVDSSSKLFEG